MLPRKHDEDEFKLQALALMEATAEVSNGMYGKISREVSEQRSLHFMNLETDHFFDI